MKALVAIGLCCFKAVLLKTWPEAKGPSDPWGAEMEAVGSSQIDEMGVKLPSGGDISGLWIWEGVVEYTRGYENAPTWRGEWRRATDVELTAAFSEMRKP